MAAMTCPRCGAYADFQATYSWARAMPGRGQVGFGVWLCSACWEPVIGESMNNDIGETVPVSGTTYPQGVPDPKYPSNLPTDVAQDGRDAHRCFAIGAWRASAAMTRRALQGACFDQGAPDTRLEEQIDWLESERRITPQMKDIAHRIRLGGNIGAHPDKDGLKDVGEDEAKELLEFLDHFVLYVYEIPQRLGGLGGAPGSP